MLLDVSHKYFPEAVCYIFQGWSNNYSALSCVTIQSGFGWDWKLFTENYSNSTVIVIWQVSHIFLSQGIFIFCYFGDSCISIFVIEILEDHISAP